MSASTGATPNGPVAVADAAPSRREVSALAPDSGPLFTDTFPSATIDPAKWEMSFAASDAGCGHGISAPNSLRLDAGEDVRSRPIDLAGSATGWVSFWLKRGDDQGSPVCADAAGDHALTIDYLNATSAWNCLLLYQHGTAGACPAANGLTQSETTGWWARRLSLPADALWSGFRLRFTACCNVPGMDWAIDDVYVWEGRPPAAPTLVAPVDAQRGGDFSPLPDRPKFVFSTTDPESDRISYRVQVSTEPEFLTTLIDARSATDPGFLDLTGGSVEPFVSGHTIRYLPPAALPDDSVFYWRVRATDLGSPAAWSPWSRFGPNLIFERFTTANLSREVWQGSEANVSAECGYAPGSPPTSLHVSMNRHIATTGAMDLSAAKGAVMRFWLFPGTGAGPPECPYNVDFGDELWLEYLTSAGTWQCLRAYYTSGGGICTGGLPYQLPEGWHERWVPLPPGAVRDGVKFRFRTETSGPMSWGIDDLRIEQPSARPPWSIQTSTPVIQHRWNQTAAPQFAVGALNGANASARGDGAVEYSQVRLEDRFPDPTLDFVRKWQHEGTSQASAGNACGSAPSSGPNALLFAGTLSAVTKRMNLSFASGAYLDFWYRGGDGAGSCTSVLSGDTLYIDYLSPAFLWECLIAFDMDGTSACTGPTQSPSTAWDQMAISLPGGALWENVQFRVSSDTVSGVFGVDDLRIVVSSLPRPASVESPPIRFADGPPGRLTWGELSWREAENVGARVDVAVMTDTTPDCTGNRTWTGVESGTSPISLTRFTQTDCLWAVANFTSTQMLPAVLLDWEVSWINNPAPSVVSTDPADGASGVFLGSIVVVRFSLPMEPNATAKSLSISPPVANSSSSVSGSELRWSHADDFSPLTTYTVVVNRSARSQQGVPLASDHAFSFTTGPAAPRVVSTFPANASTRVDLGANVTVEFTEVMEPASTAAAFSVVPAVSGGFAVVSGRNLTWTHSQPFVQATLYRATIAGSAKSGSGANLSSRHSFEFTSVPPRPVVTATSPVAGATGVFALESVTVDFDMDMDPVSTEAAFSIVPDPGGSAPTVSGKRLEWTHPAKFAPATTYAVGVSSGAKSVSGEGLGTPHAFSFTTASAPSAFQSVPEPCGRIDVPRDLGMTILFNETMDKPSTDTAVTVEPAVPSGGLAWSGNALFWSHTEPLAPRTQYWLNISAAATSFAGFALEPAYSCKVTTGTEIGGRPPKIVAISPAHGTSGVALTAHVTVTFDIAMETASTGAAFSIAPGLAQATIDTKDRNLTMNHSNAPFQPGTTYVVKIAGTAKSADGASMGADFTFSFTTAGKAPPVTPSGPQIRPAEALILLLAVLLPLIVLLFLFTRRKKKKKEEEEAKKAPKEPAEPKPAETAPVIAEEGPPPAPEAEPATKVHEEKDRKPKKDPKEINPWDKLEE